VRADCGSYFITTYITTKLHDEKNRRESEKKKRSRKKQKIGNKLGVHNTLHYEDYVIALVKANVLQLNFKKRIKWLIVSLLRFQYSLYLLHL